MYNIYFLIFIIDIILLGLCVLIGYLSIEKEMKDVRNGEMTIEWKLSRKLHVKWEKTHPILSYMQNFYYDIKHLSEIPGDIYREIIWFIQRGRRGWADCDIWNFDNYISKVIQDSLLQLQKDKYGYPNNLSEQEWTEILNKMIYAFHTGYLISKNDYFYLPTAENNKKDYAKAKKFMKSQDIVVMSYDDCKRYEEGLNLFIKYFHSLWD